MTATATQDSAKFVSGVIAQIGDITTLPEVTVKIIQTVENPRSTARDLHEIIRNDPALSARILKVVNSAFYGLPGQIGNMDRAIVLLGLSAVKNIAIAASMTHLFNSRINIEGFSGAQLWKNSLGVATAARLLTSAQGRPAVEESFLAGLLHNLGFLVVLQAFPQKLADVIRKHQEVGGDFSELESQAVGVEQQAFGMALASKWRFPPGLCTSIGYHHRPMDVATVDRELATLIGVATILTRNAGIGFTQHAANREYTPEWLEVIGLLPEDLEVVAAKLAEQVAITESIFLPSS